MSFSGTVKEELLKHVPAARHCQIAELAAILHFCGHYEGLQETAESTAGAEENLGFVQNAEKNSKNPAAGTLLRGTRRGISVGKE